MNKLVVGEAVPPLEEMFTCMGAAGPTGATGGVALADAPAGNGPAADGEEGEVLFLLPACGPELSEESLLLESGPFGVGGVRSGTPIGIASAVESDCTARKRALSLIPSVRLHGLPHTRPRNSASH